MFWLIQGAFFVKRTTIYMTWYIYDKQIKFVISFNIKNFRYDTGKQKFEPLWNGTFERNNEEEPI